MEYEKEIIRELLSSIELLLEFREPPEEIAPQFHSWILHVSDALEVAEMDKELIIWQRALETVRFSDDDSSLPVQMSSLRTVMLGMQKKLDKSNGKVTQDELLKVMDVSDDFYNKLILEINQLYQQGFTLALSVLIRKLLENLLIDILRKRYGTTDLPLYGNQPVK